MSRQKIIAIIVGVLILISLFAVFYSLSKPSKTTSPANSSSNTNSSTENVISVIAKNQTADFYLMKEGSQTKLNQIEIPRYVEYSFNSPKDIIWVSCLAGYNLSNSTSSTNSKVFSDGAGAVGIEILEDKESNLTVTCTKN